VGRGYRLSHFWLAKDVNIEVKKEVATTVLIKTIKYYENTKYTLKKGKKIPKLLEFFFFVFF
jgi:hypothetical protein